jgi:uroporphyrinogen-III decarboxylase
MTSRERVLAAFNHQETDRVPCWCGASPEFLAKARQELALPDDESFFVLIGDDFRRVHAAYCGPSLRAGTNAESRTLFGVERAGHGYGQPLSHPLAEANLAKVHAYAWPDPRWQDVSAIKNDAQRWKKQYAILGGDWSPFWHDAIDLMGMETLCLRMYDDPPMVDAVFEHIVDYYLAVSRRIFEAAADVIDVFFIGNDFGDQTGPMIGPELFERFLMPHLRRFIALGHEFGLKVQLHCCGGCEPLIEPLINAGLDGLHAVQPCCGGMDLRTLKKKYGNRLLFNGAIDSHHVLINGTPALVREKTREVLDIMSPGGGYIAGASHDYILEETPVANVITMFNTIREYQSSK